MRRDFVRSWLRVHNISILLLVGFFLLWEFVVRFGHVPSFILPPPSRVFWTFFVRFPFLLAHGTTTAFEIVLGMVLGASGGIGLGVMIFYSPSLERAIYPLIIASQMVPIFAIAPLLVLWFGYGIWPKAAVAALIVFFPIVVNTVDGFRSVSSETIDLLHSLRASEWQIFRKIRLPAGLPSLFSGLKIGATLSVVGATIGEWIGGQRGLGYLMLRSKTLLRMEVVFAAILMLSFLGMALFGGLSVAERYFLRWRKRGVTFTTTRRSR
jgi:putative hydroxymethylpyrimidine transport system permease protein